MKRLLFVSAFLVVFAFTLGHALPARAAAPDLPGNFTRVTLGAGLNQPTSIAFANNRMFVTEKGGALRIVRSDGTLRAAPFATFHVSTEVERGLLSVVLDPDYASNRYLYVYYTTGPGAKNYGGAPKNRVSRIRLAKKGDTVKEKIILDNIPSDAGNHNGGDMLFGPDGKLYISVGDSGCGTCHAMAQTLDSLRGKILRLNKDGSIPTDNPFYNTANARREIYAYGFRNPWRFGLRTSTQTFFVGDVGENTWEEVDALQAGGNYGWNVYEGPCPSSNVSCNPNTVNYNGTVKPIHWYNHGSGGDEQGNVIAGGVFAEHSNYPSPYANAYFYGDTGGNWVHVLTVNGSNQVTALNDFDDDAGGPVSFGNGPDGNIYSVAFGDNVIYKYVYNP